jgi:hypothetical protein
MDGRCLLFGGAHLNTAVGSKDRSAERPNNTEQISLSAGFADIKHIKHIVFGCRSTTTTFDFSG